MAVTRFIAKNTPTQVNTTLLGVQIQLEPTPEPPVEAIEAFVFNTSGVKFNKKETSVIQGKTEWSETWGEGESPVVPGGATVWTDAEDPAVGDVVYTNQSDLSQGQGEVEAVYPQKFPDPPVEPECLSISLTYIYEHLEGQGYSAEEMDYNYYYINCELDTVDGNDNPETVYFNAIIQFVGSAVINIDGTDYYDYRVLDSSRSGYIGYELYCTKDQDYIDSGDPVYEIIQDEHQNYLISQDFRGVIDYNLEDIDANEFGDVDSNVSIMFFAEGLPPYGGVEPTTYYIIDDYFNNGVTTWICPVSYNPDLGEWEKSTPISSPIVDEPVEWYYTFTKTENTTDYPGKVEWKYDSGDGDEFYVWTDDDTPEVNDGAYYNPFFPSTRLRIEAVQYTEPDEPEPVDPYEPPAPDEPNCVVSYSITGEADTWTDVDTTLTDLNNVIANIPRYIYLKFSQDVIITEE